jgi:hypothetical protein
VTLFDENAEVLAQLAGRGVDLSRARNVDFSHLFTEEAQARLFAQKAVELGYESQVSLPETNRLEWDVTSTIVMIPTCENITNTENRLADIADVFGGVPDGWGFLSG